MILNADWSWDHTAARAVVERAKLVFVPNPNSPSGNRWSDADVTALVPPKGVAVLDEAYGDFADEPHRAQVLQTDAGRRIVITRTLSKSYSLAGVRFGFAIAHPDLIRGMRKVKDSYNCNTLSLAAALAAIEDQDWMRDNVDKIRRTRQRLSDQLIALGFAAVPSQANFVWATHPSGRHRDIYEALKGRKILVRYMAFADVPWAPSGTVDGLRITVGTDEEVDLLLAGLREIV
jgi:histidinol-phosphate aminotransferase